MTREQRPGIAHRMLDRAAAWHWKLARARYGVRVERDLAVPARDGITLRTDHYLPGRAAGRGTVLIRTPYGRGMPAGMDARLLAGQGYHVVVQSCRGTFGSGGEFVPMAHDIDDGQDAVAWLREQPWFDGRLATYGASAVGWTQWALLVDPPPELRTAVIVAGPHDIGLASRGEGALRLHDLLTWSRVLVGQERTGVLGTMLTFASATWRNARVVSKLPLGDAVDAALRNSAPWFGKWLSISDLGDPFWRACDASAALEKVTVPIRLATGWQDLFLSQTLRQYEILRERGVDVSLTVGPWHHQRTVSGGAGLLPAGHFAWLAEHLAGEPARSSPAPVRFRVTGTHEWRENAEWPPPARELVQHLRPGGRLGPEAATGGTSFDYDPADPTPTVAGPLIDLSAGVRDNRALEARPDVLTFTTAPLPGGLEIVGTPVVELDHSRSNPHADVFVRLCDVDKRGRSRNFAEGFRRLDPATGDSVVRLELDPCAHRLAPGHRLRLQVSGGSFPRFPRNEGTDAPAGTGTELRPCRHTVRHRRSRVLLPVPR